MAFGKNTCHSGCEKAIMANIPSFDGISHRLSSAGELTRWFSYLETTRMPRSRDWIIEGSI